MEIEKTSLHPKEPVVTIKEESHEYENQIDQSAYEEDHQNSSENNIVDTFDAEKDEVAEHELKVAIDAKTASSALISSPVEGSSVKRDYVDTDASNMTLPSIMALQLEDTDIEETANIKNDELAPTSSVGETQAAPNSEKTKSKSDE